MSYRNVIVIFCCIVVVSSGMYW